MKILAIGIFAFLLVGCGSSHNIDVRSIESIRVSYFENHDESSHVQIDGNDSRLEKFREWLDQNRSDWQRYYATVAAGEIMIKGDGFSLSVGQDWVVLNYERSPGNYEQLSKDIVGHGFDFLIQSAL